MELKILEILSKPEFLANVGSFAFIVAIMLVIHYRERKEWKAQIDKQFSTTDKQFDSVVNIAKEVSSTNSELKTLLESIERRL